jgi:hypothetical protein
MATLRGIARMTTAAAKKCCDKIQHNEQKSHTENVVFFLVVVIKIHDVKNKGFQPLVSQSLVNNGL